MNRNTSQKSQLLIHLIRSWECSFIFLMVAQLELCLLCRAYPT